MKGHQLISAGSRIERMEDRVDGSLAALLRFEERARKGLPLDGILQMWKNDIASEQEALKKELSDWGITG